jgi:HAD superfamily hydrolase (TIGR01509 family)
MALHELRAILFDFDGTIAETEAAGHRVAYNEAFEELGLPWRWDERAYGALLATAGGKERLGAFIARERPDVNEQARAELAARIHLVKQRRFRTLGGRLEFRPGIVRLVREASAAGIALAIATTAALDGVEVLLARDPEVAAAFALIAAGDVVPKKKPAPDIYTYALERLRLPALAAVAIEDSRNGLRAALAAGLTTVVTPSAYSSQEDFTGADAVLSDLGEPGAPAHAAYGPAPPRGYVDVAYLEALAESSTRKRPF